MSIQKEIKVRALLSPTELLPQKFTLRRQLAKQSIRKHRNKQKESLKWAKKEPTIERDGRLPSKKKINEMEASKQSDIEFKRMVIGMVKGLTGKYKELNGNYNSVRKEIESIKKNQEEMKNIIYEIKNI